MYDRHVGAGRSLSQRVHFSEMNENLSAMQSETINTTGNRAIFISSVRCIVIFTPHLVPMTRGILSTIMQIFI
ncbi:hypothetical protein ACV56Z_10570 [Staphylococcus aureus]